MSEQTFEQMLEESLKTIHTGEVVKGTVIDVKPEEIILNIGYKSDGVLTKNEYTNEPNVDLTDVVKLGDIMEVKVLKVNDGEGQVILTYKRLAVDRSNKRIEEAFKKREVLTAKVVQVLEGGLSVIIDEVKIFIPASLVSDTYEKDLSKYAGKEIQFVISEYNPKRRRYIGDRRQLLNEERAELQKKLFETIQVGDVVEGTVKNVTDFGAFIDIGGADGLLHISEMSWGRVENPKKVFKVGQSVKAFIKEINGTKIALSLKFDYANPWKDAEITYAVGKEVTGRVARMTDFGAFIELEAGVDALLHVSQIAKEHIEKPSDVLKVNDRITAKVVDFNEADKKISLSIKALLVSEVAETVEEAVPIRKETDETVAADAAVDSVIAADETAAADTVADKTVAVDATADESIVADVAVDSINAAAGEAVDAIDAAADETVDVIDAAAGEAVDAIDAVTDENADAIDTAADETADVIDAAAGETADVIDAAAGEAVDAIDAAAGETADAIGAAAGEAVATDETVDATGAAVATDETIAIVDAVNAVADGFIDAPDAVADIEAVTAAGEEDNIFAEDAAENAKEDNKTDN